MSAAIDDAFGDLVETTNPEGGFFSWLTFRNALENLDTGELFTIALEDGVAYIPGAAFTIDKSMNNALRLCFATSSEDRIREGVTRLRSAVSRMTGV